MHSRSCQAILNIFQLPEATETEEDLLDQAPFLDINSRLGCQLIITPAEEGLVSCQLDRMIHVNVLFSSDITAATSYSKFLCGWSCAPTTLIPAFADRRFPEIIDIGLEHRKVVVSLKYLVICVSGHVDV